MRSQNRGQDLEAEIITAAATANKTSPPKRSPPVAAKTLPAPVKRMKTLASVGKKVSANKKQFVRRSDDTESDNYIEDHAAMDGRDSSSSDSDQSTVRSDKGERVHSPVNAKSGHATTDKKKKKVKRASRSPSSSSSESSAKTELSRRSHVSHASHMSRASHVSHASRVHKKSRRAEDEEHKSKKDSARKRHSSHKHDDRDKKRSMTKSPAPSIPRSRPEPDQQIAATPSHIMPPPPTDALTNDLYLSILNAKSQQAVVQEHDTLSKGTTKSKRVVSRRQSSVGEQTRALTQTDITHMMASLDERIRTTDLCAETVNMIAATYNATKSLSLQSKRNLMTEKLQCIKHHTISPLDLQARSPAFENGYPKINDTGYLFSAVKVTFGYNFEAIQRREESAKRTLFWALSTKVNKAKNSLDIVFRNALKDLVKEIHVFDELSDNSMANPMFISGRYLELSLLERIRKFYQTTVNEDIIRFFASACPDEDSQLVNLIKGSVCERYLRQLYDRYAGSVVSFDNVLSESLGIDQMRVWTNKNNQIATNIMFVNYLSSVYQETSTEWSQNNDGKMMIKYFCDGYVQRMRAFLHIHKSFLAEMLQASELMAWVCFGITIDDLETGFRNMAISYYMIENESQKEFDATNQYICWNYPLANKYRRTKPVTTVVRMPEPEDYWNDLQDAINS